MLYDLTHALAVNVDRARPGPFFFKGGEEEGGGREKETNPGKRIRLITD